jgi:release factor glutamine methyltransferase
LRVRNPELSDDAAAKIRRLASRREKREPLAYVLGRKEFYSLDFMVNEYVLVPRPETELIVDLALYYAVYGGTVLDIGTGSGAIAVSLKHTRRDLDVYATDISPRALAVAKKNSNAVLGGPEVKFFEGRLYEPVKGMSFSLIVSNPPYIDPAAFHSLEPELGYEPRIALVADDGGRAVVRDLITGGEKHLAFDGTMIIEISETMKEFISEEAHKAGMTASIMNDYAGLPRVAVLARS